MNLKQILVVAFSLMLAISMSGGVSVVHATPLTNYWANLNLTYRFTPYDVCNGDGTYHSLIVVAHDAIEAWQRWFPQLHLTEVTTSNENITIACWYFQTVPSGHIAEDVSTVSSTRITHTEIRVSYGAFNPLSSGDLTGGRVVVAHEIGHALGLTDEQVPGLMGIGVMHMSDTIRQIRSGDDASYLIINPCDADMQLLNGTYTNSVAVPELSVSTPLILIGLMLLSLVLIKRNRK